MSNTPNIDLFNELRESVYLPVLASKLASYGMTASTKEELEQAAKVASSVAARIEQNTINTNTNKQNTSSFRDTVAKVAKAFDPDYEIKEVAEAVRSNKALYSKAAAAFKG